MSGQSWTSLRTGRGKVTLFNGYYMEMPEVSNAAD